MHHHLPNIINIINGNYTADSIGQLQCKWLNTGTFTTQCNMVLKHHITMYATKYQFDRDACVHSNHHCVLNEPLPSRVAVNRVSLCVLTPLTKCNSFNVDVRNLIVGSDRDHFSLDEKHTYCHGHLGPNRQTFADTTIKLGQIEKVARATVV